MVAYYGIIKMQPANNPWTPSTTQRLCGLADRLLTVRTTVPKCLLLPTQSKSLWSHQVGRSVGRRQSSVLFPRLASEQIPEWRLEPPDMGFPSLFGKTAILEGWRASLNLLVSRPWLLAPSDWDNTPMSQYLVCLPIRIVRIAEFSSAAL